MNEIIQKRYHEDPAVLHLGTLAPVSYTHLRAHET